MKVQILQENLNKGLITASRIISSKAQLPILANVLLKTDNGRLQISATNLENGISLWIGSKVEKEGEITIPARVLSEVVSSLPAGKVDFEVTDNSSLTLSSGGYNARFNGISSSEFPKLPTYLPENLISLPANKLLQAINQVAFAAATDEGRPVLTGVLLKISGSSLSLVATDGYRLSVKQIELEKPVTENVTLILPAKTLMEVSKLITEEKKEENPIVRMGFTKEQNQVVFVFSELELFSRVIDGIFPDYEKIIPKTSTSKIFLDKESFGRAVKIVSIFARESANIVKFKVKNGVLEMSANSPQVGDNLNSLEIKLEGDEGEIAFNFRFLQGFLTAISGSEITIEMNGPLSSGIFREVGDESFLHIIMPVRLQTE